ncbi:MAG: saccharopine dehydrogenase C-terminal domain-containing protein [Chloroflexota bacterium]
MTFSKIPFSGRIVILGCGSISVCMQWLLLHRLDADFSKCLIIDFEDLRDRATEMLNAGAMYLQLRLTPENFTEVFSQYLSAGDLLIDLAWQIETLDVIQWCHDHGVLYVNTSIEQWNPYEDLENSSPADRALSVLYGDLFKVTDTWRGRGPTAIIDHGANPGLVSHWTKVALHDVACAILQNGKADSARAAGLERALSENDFARVAMLSGVKVLHISERDTQISNLPKQENEFVNTWSIEAFYEEALSPVEAGWGTHERALPPKAYPHNFHPRCQISLAQMGMNTWVRSWIPSGEIVGMAIRHSECFTICDHLTVWDADTALYRPTTFYVYLPSDAAIASVHEMKMNNYQLQPKHRIMTDDITEGRDELGVLLLGHDLNGWWTGSLLDIHETRRLVPHQNATILQVAASAFAAMVWMIRNPDRGLLIPDQLPYQEILEIANPYLGPCPSIQTDWTPLKNRFEPFKRFGSPPPLNEDVWQFETFLSP